MKIVKETKIGKVEIEIPINIGDKIDEKYVINQQRENPQACLWNESLAENLL